MEGQRGYCRDEPAWLSSGWIYGFNWSQLPFLSLRAVLYRRVIWNGHFRPVFQSYGMQVWALVGIQGHHFGILRLQQKGCSG